MGKISRDNGKYPRVKEETINYPLGESLMPGGGGWYGSRGNLSLKGAGGRVPGGGLPNGGLEINYILFHYTNIPYFF